MKRFLLDTYRLRLTDPVRRAVPAVLMAAAAAMLYRLTGHPDPAFHHARHLTARGQGAQAAARYGTGALIEDPLFACTVDAAARAGGTGDAAGRFHASFGHAGLKITAELRVPAGGDLPERLEICVDGLLLRSERLFFRGGRARVLYTVKRLALDHFPPVSNLMLRTDRGGVLTFDGQPNVRVQVPHGRGGLERAAPLDKKGCPRIAAQDLHQRQGQYLALYTRANAIFEREFGRPLFLVCGTLLGQHRDGDFIPGDDDFDVGYVAEGTTATAVKAESVAIIERLVARGMIVSLNREGKALRLSDAQSGPDLHLDITPVFTLGDGHVWLHKLARLPISLDSFRQVGSARLRGVEVTVPAGTEAFLAAYYGPGWRVPDPAFTYGNIAVPAEVRQRLRDICLTRADQRALMARIRARALPGVFAPLALKPPYPLDLRVDEAD